MGAVVKNNKGEKFDSIMYGLEGIMTIFHVSKTTAHRYKEGFLKGAVSQQGNKILVDTEQALRLFGIKDPMKYIKTDNSSAGFPAVIEH